MHIPARSKPSLKPQSMDLDQETNRPKKEETTNLTKWCISSSKAHMIWPYQYKHVHSLITMAPTNFLQWEKQMQQRRTYVLPCRHFFLGLDLDRRRALPVLPELPPKMAQRMQPDTLGEGGSTSGATSLVRNTCCWLLRASSLCPCFCFFSFARAFLLSLSPPPRRSMPMLPTLLECRSSGWGSSAAPSLAFASASASVRKRSSQTRPEEPDLLKVVADLCNPAMGAYPPPLFFSSKRTRQLICKCGEQRVRTNWTVCFCWVLPPCPLLQAPSVLYM